MPTYITGVSLFHLFILTKFKDCEQPLRKCLKEEFSSIYVFNLKGAIRGKSGDNAKKEGQNVFNIVTGVAITILVKNQKAKTHGHIYFHDIESYLNREEKPKTIEDLHSIKGIDQQNGWQTIIPDKYNDWINQRDDRFSDYISLGDKKDKGSIAIFENYSNGLKTQRDAWCYNSSPSNLLNNMSSSIDFYNTELERYIKVNPKNTENFINFDSSKISWTRALKWDLEKSKKAKFSNDNLIQATYRPFYKQWLYFDRQFNEMVYQIPQIFPTAKTKNKIIMIKQRWSGDGQFVLIMDCIPDLQSDGGSQCFPLYLYNNIESKAEDKGSLFAEEESTEPKQRDSITDKGLAHFAKAYPTETISKEDLFYYIYGLLHSEDYRTRYADNLTKELPRIPAVKKVEDFWHFSKAGRALGKR